MALSTENMVRISMIRGIQPHVLSRLSELPGDEAVVSPQWIRDNLEGLRFNEVGIAEIQKGIIKGNRVLEKNEKLGIRVCSVFDPWYPYLLKSISSCPRLLYIKGDPSLLTRYPSIAVVGTRHPSGFGLSIGERIGYRLAEDGINVVSGLALGIDTAAHRGSLKAGGLMTAVLAHGLDRVYPKENRLLAEQIVDSGGLLVSEYVVGTQPFPLQFVARNRIQAGISGSVIVVETALKGGTMTTANLALEFGRTLAVFKHPYPFNTNESKGNRHLLTREGVMKLANGKDLNRLISMSLDRKADMHGSSTDNKTTCV